MRVAVRRAVPRPAGRPVASGSPAAGRVTVASRADGNSMSRSFAGTAGVTDDRTTDGPREAL